MTDPPPRATSATVARGARILLVDDDAMVLRTWRRLLLATRPQWEVATAEGGARALELMAERTFDVIVTDLQMPEMTGLELLRIVKERYPDTVRVVCSGRLETLDEELSGHLLHVVVEKSAPDGLVDAVSQALRYSPIALQDAASS